MLTLKLKETMTGWLELNENHHQEPVEITIDVIFMKRLKPWQPQPFTGSLRLPNRDYETETHGYLTIKPAGSRYELRFDLPDVGPVQAVGEKTYDVFNLKESLTLCPLTLFKEGQAIGYSEVAYSDSIMAFPFRSMRLTSYALS